MRQTRGNRNFFAAMGDRRCIAHAPTTVKGEGAQCMRRKMVGDYCTQHYKLLVEKKGERRHD